MAKVTTDVNRVHRQSVPGNETHAATESDLNREPGVPDGCPRPIFVIGSLRSGASLLTIVLGQHPNLVPVLQTNWFERFAIGLQQAYVAGIAPQAGSQLEVVGIEIEDYFEHFGEAINRLMLRTRLDESPGSARWVDGTQSNSMNVFPLIRLFPHAKFIHVLRDVSEVVGSLSDPENERMYRSRHITMTPKQATDHWLDTVMACVQAERAFGSETVLRIRRKDLIDSPEATVRRCLAFLDEPFDPACQRPLRSLADEVTVASDAASITAQAQPSVAPLVGLVSALLLDDPSPWYPRDDLAIARLESDFSIRCEAELSSSGSRRSKSGRSSKNTGASMVPHTAIGRLIWPAVGQAIRSRLGRKVASTAASG